MDRRRDRVSRREVVGGAGLVLGGVFGLALLTRAGWSPVPASPPSRVYRIGYLTSGSPDDAAHLLRLAAFRAELAALGYVDGQNVTLVVERVDAPSEGLAASIERLVRLPVDVLAVAVSTVGGQAVRLVGAALPVVMTSSSDPIRARLLTDPVHPIHNVTGTTLVGTHLPSTQLALLLSVVPYVQQVAVLGPADPDWAAEFQEIRAAAAGHGVAIQGLAVPDPAEMGPNLRALEQGGADAVIVLASPLTDLYRAEIVAVVREQAMPGMYGSREFVDAGGLMAYGPSLVELHRRAAHYVARILEGACGGPPR